MTLLKFIAAALLIAAAWGIGQENEARLRRREKRLYALLDGLLCMEGEIRSCLSPLPAALAQANRYDALFGRAAQLSSESDVTSAFLEALSSEPLAKTETEILTAFANGLSAADEKGQLQNLAACRKRLEGVAEAARNDVSRLGRLYSGGGVMMGLLVVILLF